MYFLLFDSTQHVFLPDSSCALIPQWLLLYLKFLLSAICSAIQKRICCFSHLARV